MRKGEATYLAILFAVAYLLLVVPELRAYDGLHGGGGGDSTAPVETVGEEFVGEGGPSGCARSKTPVSSAVYE